MAVANTLPPSFRHPLLIDGYRKSCVVGASGPNCGLAAGLRGWRCAVGCRAAGAGTASGGAVGTGSARLGQVPQAASGAGPTALAGSTPAGRCASAPGTAPGAGTCAAAGCATKLLTAVATFFESVGAAELPVNAAAAAMSVETALYGSDAAF